MVEIQSQWRAVRRFLVILILLTLSTGPFLPRSRAAQPSLASLAAPRLLVLTPCGGKAGTTVEVVVSGQGFTEPEGLFFSEPGIKAELLTAAPQPAPQPMRNRRPRRGGIRGPVGSLKFKVTIPEGTALGMHDVRVVTKGGISNPRAFIVGDLREVQEKEPNNDVGQAQQVKMNTAIHGSISAPTDVDYFVFSGKKGQRIIASCLSSSIDSRLPVALELYDKKDRLLTSNRAYQGDDALLDCTLPENGDYYLRLSAFAYTQGGPDNFYRLTISTAPWIDGVYPPMVEPGKRAKLTVYGRNLPGGKPEASAIVDGRVLEKVVVSVDVPKNQVALQQLNFTGHIPPKSSALDGFEYRIRNDTGSSNAVLLTYARAPVIVDNEKNDTPETAQEVSVPCEIAGRIEKKRDRDWYTFHADKGAVYSIEAYGDRLGSPIDLYWVLREARTKRVLVELDDNQDQLGRNQFFTRSVDPPRYRFVAPAEGDYQLLITSREAGIQAGPRDMYRVRITPEQPDFRLVVMPSSGNSPDACILRRGGYQDYSIFVWRLDGWNGPITVTAENLPTGVRCWPLTVAPGVKEAALVLHAEADAPFWTGAIKVKGTASVDGHTVAREARPATITWPVPPINIPAVSRLDRSLVLAVRDRAPFSLDVGVEKVLALHQTPVTIPLKVTRHWPDFKFPIFVFATNLPGRIPQRPIVLNPGKDENKLVVNIPPNVPPGVYTVVLRGVAQTGGRRGIPFGQNFGIVQPASPITFTVIPRRLDRVALAPTKLKVRPGSQTEVLVKIPDNYRFIPGGFKVQLVSRSSFKGITAEEAAIPEGKERAKLVVAVEEDVKPGATVNLVVRVKAVVNKTTISQDVNLNVAVVK
jgi:hypothetical protein